MFHKIKFFKSMSIDPLLKMLVMFGLNWQSGKVYPDWQDDVSYYFDGFVQHDHQIYRALNPSGPDVIDVGPKIPGVVGNEDYWIPLHEFLAMTTTTSLSTRWTFVGDIQELHRPASDLPFGWFALFGDGFPKESVQGKQLLMVKNQSWWQQYQQSVPIVETDDSVYLPNWKATDGRMPITRPVDNVTRTVGSLEQDAIRNLTGEWSRGNAGSLGTTEQLSYFTGVYKRGSKEYTDLLTSGSYRSNAIAIDASLQVPTASENRVLSRGTTIAMFLNAPKP